MKQNNFRRDISLSTSALDTPAEDGKAPVATQDARRRKYLGKRELLLIAIALVLVAVFPTMAKQIGGVTVTEGIGTGLDHTEIADDNFPGSAFYYMEQNYSAPNNSMADMGIGSSEALLPPESVDPALVANIVGIGGTANGFSISPSSMGYQRALKCLSDAIYYESAKEPDDGKRAVAQVIINRMRHPTYPNTICGVIYQGSERRTGCQFSYACDGSMARRPDPMLWERGRQIAANALAGYVHKPVGMATHYHATYVNPYWAPSLHYISTIGLHRFYRWRGSAGRPSAFFRSYAGAEPLPMPKPKRWTPSVSFEPVLDPIQLQRKYEREYAAARLQAERDAAAATRRSVSVAPPPAENAYTAIQPSRQKAAPAYAPPIYSETAKERGGESAYSGQNLPDATNIKPEYQQSGTWKKQPGDS